MKQPLIRAESVSFDYVVNRNDVIPVLRDVSFSIYPGEYVAIIGHNGSGKSTLAKHLNGILKPIAGNVFVNGLNTKEDKYRRSIRQQVGMVFQHPDNQIVATIVEDDVAFGLENIGVPGEEMKERIDFALDAVGMSTYRNRPPHHLSGGQKQRIAIAGIIAMRPQCLVLDEATGMLDAYGRRDILRVVRKLHREGMTIVTVTHHMSEAAEADRVLVIESGRIVMEGTPREIFQQQEMLHQLQLDVPEASRMARLIHDQVPAFQSGLISQQEMIDEVRRLSGIRGADAG
ncbi:energy-coupling factor transport system ATP-binding protein/energy-coupling factor transport system ATP-binding protein [Lihuaxuella thermophila]|uniref:Energy-coupling factor transport system ATP-binding protein/energy-coupling factor transport system ATP-binding protein n=2 Tax=Lihuaxuella thermophila TaxID=1173111 RepID=A0A1H8EJR9_9BACL|nr:energy-coupling factor transport system ATP-binding protein/energy-coupling factor transport system ATP-binding protein [Lihuaxuella thermophila]